MRVVALAAMVLLAGCAGQFGEYGDGNEVAIAGNGSQSGSDSKQLQCSQDQAQVAVGFNGQGTIKVTVKDGLGLTVYEKSFEGQGQSGETKEFSGEPGTWTLKVDFSGTFFGGAWQGQYGIYLRC